MDRQLITALAIVAAAAAAPVEAESEFIDAFCTVNASSIYSSAHYFYLTEDATGMMEVLLMNNNFDGPDRAVIANQIMEMAPPEHVAPIEVAWDLYEAYHDGCTGSVPEGG